MIIIWNEVLKEVLERVYFFKIVLLIIYVYCNFVGSFIYEIKLFV